MLHKSHFSKRQQKIVLLFTAFITLACLSRTSSAATPESTRLFVKKRIATFYSWLNAPWTGNDAPYQTLRDNIDIALAKASHPTEIVQTYENQFTKTPTDSKVLFAYAYSTYKVTELPNGISYSLSHLNFGGVYDSIASAKNYPPHTYNYARLAFLENASLKNSKLISIGKRLLKHSPNDDEVEYALATVLIFSEAPADHTLAVSYQQDLVRRFPNDQRPYRLLGLIHYRTAWLTHSQAEADKSIAAYQRAFELSPKDKTTQSEGEMTIKFIQNLKTQWKQNG